LRYAIGSRAPLPGPPMTTTTAQAAYQQVLDQAGCSLPARDSLDRRLSKEVRAGAGGTVDRPEDLGGWPVLKGGQAPPDGDHDGTSDDWERRYGLNGADPSDAAGDLDHDGYTNIEEYCNRTNPTRPEPPPPAFDLARMREQVDQALAPARRIMAERRNDLDQRVAALEEQIDPNTKPMPADKVSQLPPKVTIDLGGGVTMDFVLVPAGTFTMGSPPGEPLRDEEEVQHQVTISRPFYLAATELTRSQAAAISGRRVSGESGQLPDQFNWADAGDLCVELSAKTGRRCRMPTEAEWEYACRAGTTTPFSTGDTISTDQANFDGTTPYGASPLGIVRDRAVPAGSLPPNPWGLREMHGNVWEWCLDTLRDYPKVPASDPVQLGPGRKIIRGGCMESKPRYIRSASRYSYLTRVGYGLRAVMEAQ